MASYLLYKNAKVKTQRTIILPATLYGCKTWSLTFWKEYTLKVFQNRMLRKSEVKMKEGQEATKICIMRKFIIYTLNKILLR
jgi:hypothetical protein